MMARRVIAGRGGFSPKALFAAGEQGVWYDPSDFSTLFQNAAGTTPVTAVEQPVGLILDKSKGLVLGPELVTNGTFDTDTTGWTANDATLSVVGGKLRVDTGVDYGRAFQAIPVTAGKIYQVKAVVTAVSGNTSTTVQFSSNLETGGGVAVGTFSFDSGSRDVVFYWTAPETRSYAIVLQNNTTEPNSVNDFDNISVRELPGNHAFQTTSANRPTLSAWYNLLTKTEQFDDAAISKQNVTVSTNMTTAPNGENTADLLIETTSNSVHNARWFSLVAQSSTTYKGTIYVKAFNRTWFYIDLTHPGYINYRTWFNLTTGTVGVNAAGNVPSITNVGNGWFLCEVSRTTASNQTAITFEFGPSTSDNSTVYTGDGTSGIYIWGADLRVANDGVGIPAYQRVNTSTDYDTTGFPPYLRFNGSNSAMQTNSVDFTATDKMTVFAGVRKLSDASAGCVVEISSNYAANNGTFTCFAPGSNFPTGYDWPYRGTAVVITPGFAAAAPITNVISSAYNIAAPSAVIRSNGAQVSSSTTGAGTGNYGNYPLYIGARGGSSLYFNGRLYSLIVRGAQTPANLIAATERYVARKTGVTL